MTVDESRSEHAEVAALLAEAAEWRLIGLLLERPRPGWHDEITALSREVRDAALRAAAVHGTEVSEGEYLFLLGPGGAVSPREVTYRSSEDPGWVLSAVATAYEAFAFKPLAEDPIDHIAIEVGFVAYLLLKEAFAGAAGDGDAAETTAAARRMFLETHLAPMAIVVAQRLAAIGPSALAETARILAARVPPVPIIEPRFPASDGPAGCGLCPVDDEPPPF